MKDKSRKLTAKQQQFCLEFSKDWNGTQAAIRAGYSPNTSNEQAARLLAKVSIQERVAQLQTEARKQTEITRGEVLGVLASILRSDVPDYFEGGKLKDFDKLTPAQRKALESVKFNKHGFEFKLPSKIQAVATVNKMLGYDAATDFNIQLQNLNDEALDRIIEKLMAKQ
ncbi:MAG: terminase small subunit [Mangrovibacterium sp.]